MSKSMLLACVAVVGAAGLAYGDGLTADYGKDLETVVVGGKTYKVIGCGVLAPRKSITIEGVQFEKNAPVVVIGEGKGPASDLDLVLTESNGGGFVGQDVLKDNVPVVTFQTGNPAKTLVDVKVQNAGTKPCTYRLLANY